MSDPIVNHDEATQLAEMKQNESNLARCYLALRAQVEELTQERDEALRMADEGSRDQLKFTMDIAHQIQACGLDSLPALCAAYKAAEARADALAKDVEFLSSRAEGANKCSFSDDERDTGVSSNAIVRLAFGGEAPTGGELPFDQSDLDACKRAVSKLPQHRRTPEVMKALDAAIAAIAEPGKSHE